MVNLGEGVRGEKVPPKEKKKRSSNPGRKKGGDVPFWSDNKN